MSFFSRLLRRMVLVNPEEVPALLWSAAYFFFLLTSYYMARPVREMMGVEKGADNLAWLMTGTMIAMFMVNPLFSWLVSRMPRRRFIPITYHVCAATMVGFWGAMVLAKQVSPRTVTYVGYAFYIWLSVFNLFAVSVFWSLLADLFKTEQGKRLFGFVGVLGTIGGIIGPLATSRLVGHIGPGGILLISAVLLELAVVCIHRLTGLFGPKESGDEQAGAARSAREPGPGVLAGVAIVARSPYFLLICVYLFLYTVLNTFLYMEQGRIVSLAKHGNVERTQAFAHIDMWVNTLTAILQVFVASRLMKKIGVGFTLGLLPAVSAIGFAALWITAGAAERAGANAAQALQTALTSLIIFQVARRGMHYALSQPARQVLFTGLGPDEIYKSKPFIDTFVYRAGDLAGAWAPRLIVRAAQGVGMAAGSAVAAAAIPIALVSLGVGLVLGVMQKRQGKVRTGAGSEREALELARPG